MTGLIVSWIYWYRRCVYVFINIKYFEQKNFFIYLRIPSHSPIFDMKKTVYDERFLLGYCIRQNLWILNKSFNDVILFEEVKMHRKNLITIILIGWYNLTGLFYRTLFLLYKN